MFLCICVSVLCICISLHKCICVSLYQCICVSLFLCACDIFVSVYMCDSVIKYCTLLKKSLNNQKSVLVLYYCDYESYKNGPKSEKFKYIVSFFRFYLLLKKFFVTWNHHTAEKVSQQVAFEVPVRVLLWKHVLLAHLIFVNFLLLCGNPGSL